MSAIDLVLVTCVVAVAAAYLAWAMLGRRTPPACHNASAPVARPDASQNVVIGASLQRGLDRARAKRR